MFLLHVKNSWFQLRLFGFIVTAIFLIIFFKTMTQDSTIEAAIKKTKVMLMTNKAISNYVEQEQKTSIDTLKKNNILDKEYFNPKLQSASYIIKAVHHLYNKEQKKNSHSPYQFKFASSNPLNPTNRADTFELSILKKMNSKKITEYTQVTKKGTKHYLYYAIATDPITKSCLKCHGNPNDAPKSLIKEYSSNSGFGYKVGEIIAMESIYTPIDEELKAGEKLFIYLSSITIIILLGVFILTEYVFLQLSKKRFAQERNLLLEDKLAYQNEALQKSLNIISQHIMLSKTDKNGVITSVSDALCQISGYTKEELIGKAHNIIRHPDTASKTFEEMWKRIKKGETWQGEIKNCSKDGKYFWVDIIVTPDFDEEHEIIGYSSFWHDASHKKRMELMSITDTLTRLYNRRYFENIFKTERMRAKRDNKLFIFLMLDLDYFKRYNDTYGHQAGDQVLIQVAQCMQKIFQRAGDFSFRLGGEEFGIIYSAKTNNDAIKMANRLRKNIEFLEIEHKSNKASEYVSTSVGVVVIAPETECNLTMDKLISKADDALYEAKSHGRNKVCKASL